MADARVEEAWNHTAAVLAMLANVNRDPRRTPAFRPADFHPVHAARRKPPKADITILKAWLVEAGKCTRDSGTS